MKELWWMACGNMDREVRAQAFWTAAFGKKPTVEQLEKMHPLRRFEGKPAEVEKTPAQVATESELGWAAMFAAVGKCTPEGKRIGK